MVAQDALAAICSTLTLSRPSRSHAGGPVLMPVPVRDISITHTHARWGRDMLRCDTMSGRPTSTTCTQHPACTGVHAHPGNRSAHWVAQVGLAVAFQVLP